jgi:hypothetical protein
LGYFAASSDPHAQQYLNAVNAIFDITRTHALEREVQHRKERKRASAALFGLYSGTDHVLGHQDSTALRDSVEIATEPPESSATDLTTGYGDIFALPWLEGNDLDLQSFLRPDRESVEGGFNGVPLFPIHDQRPTNTDPDLPWL